MDLNPSQKRAVEHPGGPLLMAAGAGSGKTRALTSRLKGLISRGIPPEEIIAITFTNKAADQMRDRVFGPESRKPSWNDPFPARGIPFIGTFHALGLRILKAEIRLTNRRPGFSIFDDDDSLRLIKKILKELDLDKERFRPPIIAAKISAIKGELQEPGMLQLSENKYDQLIGDVYFRYEKALAENNAFDFDDLIEKPVRLLTANKELRTKYQELFSQILVDEYQDINTSQYQLVRLLLGPHQNLSVVGDDMQCLTPDSKILTTNGLVAINQLTKKNKLQVAGGNGKLCEAGISAIKKFHYRGQLIKITTTGGRIIRLTPNHLIFFRPQLTDGIYYVYLMYRKDKGFRIGLAKGSRWGRNGRQIGLIVRSNQEKADKIWILKVCPNRNEAEYWEYYYAFHYGIPTLVFDTGNRSMKLNQKQIDALFTAIDTKKRAQKLFQDELLYFAYPHWVPQGTIRHSARRLRVRITLFDDRRRSLISPWGMSRISINTKDQRLKKLIEQAGFKTRKGKLTDWRMELTRLDYGEIEKIAARIEKQIPAEVELVRSACLTDKKRLFFQPASHARPTMTIAVRVGDKIAEDTIAAIATENYDGLVYDLNINKVHNYIAGDIVVHNSIYSFRGADFRNFLNFERDWPEATVILLEQNYRSTKNILSAANALIKNNQFQKPKALWTENNEGELIQLIAAEDPETEAVWLAAEIAELRTKNKELSIAILYRTNAQSRSIEQSLISENLPYKIFGGLKFYERKEIKDVVAGLRLAVNPDDTVSAERLEKSLGKRNSEKLFAELKREATHLGLLELINFFLSKTNYAELLEDKFFNPEERLENIAELTAFASQFSSISEFLERVSLLQSTDIPSHSSITQLHNYAITPITLMTIHMAKGLEFDYVFVAGCNEGLLPHEKSLREQNQVEEERRLMYVAMTRARKKLYLLFHTFPSRFLYEIPNELINFISPTGNLSELPDEDEMYLEN